MENNIFNAFLKTFEPSNDLIRPDNKTVRQFENILPDELIEFWKQYGFGNYGGGLIKIINPKEYTDSLYEWFGRDEDFAELPFLVTGFGDIFFYRKFPEDGEDCCFQESGEDICLLDVYSSRINVCADGFHDFFNSFIVNEGVIKGLLKKELFEKARQKKGAIKYDDVYYFPPATTLAGGEDIKYVNRGTGTAIQSLLRQTGYMCCGEDDPEWLEKLKHSEAKQVELLDSLGMGADEWLGAMKETKQRWFAFLGSLEARVDAFVTESLPKLKAAYKDDENAHTHYLAVHGVEGQIDSVRKKAREREEIIDHDFHFLSGKYFWDSRKKELHGLRDLTHDTFCQPCHERYEQFLETMDKNSQRVRDTENI